MALPVKLEPYQSFFVVFDKKGKAGPDKPEVAEDFPASKAVMTLTGPWTVAFDPAWGGPERIVFDRLDDWSTRPEDGIRHYSGIATYSLTFDLPDSEKASKSATSSSIWASSRIWPGLGLTARTWGSSGPRPGE